MHALIPTSPSVENVSRNGDIVTVTGSYDLLNNPSLIPDHYEIYRSNVNPAFGDYEMVAGCVYMGTDLKITLTQRRLQPCTSPTK